MSLQAPRPQLPDAAPPTHYVVLCALCLGVMFLCHLQQGFILGGLLVVMVGVFGLMSRLGIGPFLLLVFVGGVDMYYQRQFGGFAALDQRAGYAPSLHELLMCAAVLGYVIGHYRLQAVWHNLWPEDRRLKAGPERRPFPWLRRRQPIVREKRPPTQIVPIELVWLFMSLPVWALIGLGGWSLLSQRWNVVGLPPVMVRVLFVVLFLAIVSLAARMVFGFWRHRRRDAEAARLFLQDVLWKETRGEQRRINRWLAWAKKSG